MASCELLELAGGLWPVGCWLELAGVWLSAGVLKRVICLLEWAGYWLGAGVLEWAGGLWAGDLECAGGWL